jgi:predicted phosphodiesterase
MRLATPQRKELVEAYLRQFPTHGTWTIAKALYEANPGAWSTLNTCRSQVAFCRGEMSPNGRGAKQPISREECELPKSLADDWKPFNLPTSERVLVLNDIHIPFHDEKALEAALANGDKFCPTVVLLNGDVVDFYALSRFDKDPKRCDTATEIKLMMQFLRHLRRRYPKARVVFKFGNHDERWNKYVWMKAPALRLKELELANVLNFEAAGIEIVEDQRPIMCGRLPVLHGHELGKGAGSPVNPARGLFLKANDCALIGHLHKTSEHSETRLGGELVTTWSVGCLCDMHPEYARINKWNHGFARITVDKSGEYSLHNLRIYQGKVYGENEVSK